MLSKTIIHPLKTIHNLLGVDVGQDLVAQRFLQYKTLPTMYFGIKICFKQYGKAELTYEFIERKGAEGILCHDIEMLAGRILPCHKAQELVAILRYANARGLRVGCGIPVPYRGGMELFIFVDKEFSQMNRDLHKNFAIPLLHSNKVCFMGIEYHKTFRNCDFYSLVSKPTRLFGEQYYDRQQFFSELNIENRAKYYMGKKLTASGEIIAHKIYKIYLHHPNKKKQEMHVLLRKFLPETLCRRILADFDPDGVGIQLDGDKCSFYLYPAALRAHLARQ